MDAGVRCAASFSLTDATVSAGRESGEEWTRTSVTTGGAISRHGTGQNVQTVAPARTGGRRSPVADIVERLKEEL